MDYILKLITLIFDTDILPLKEDTLTMKPGKATKDLVQKPSSRTVKTSFNANEIEYKKLQSWCKKNGKSLSEVLNALITDFNEFVGKEK